MKRFLAYVLIAAFLTACGSPQSACAATSAQSISFLLSQVRNASGPLSGGKVYFYAAGTTTPKTVWVDRGKATPAANPYTLDSNGTAQLYGDGLYRFVIKTSTGVTVYDRDYVSIKDASGNAYDVADYASLAAAVAAIGSTPATLQYSTDQALAGNLAVPATITLQPVNGAVINHSTYTVTYPGGVAGWDDSQKFSGTGAVTMPIARPEWFGAKGDGVTDDLAIIQRCVTNSEEVLFRKKTYMLSNTITLASTSACKRVIGEGALSILKKTADSNPYVLALVSATGVTVKDLAGDGVRSTTADYTNSIFVFYLAGCTNCVLDNVHAYGALADNIVVEYGKGNKVINSWSYNCNKDGIYASGSEAVIISNNHCYGNGSNSTGGGIAVAATWGATVTGNICYDNVQFDILLSRGTRFATVTGNSNGIFTANQAPIGFYVLGEQLGGTLHGFSYGDGTTYYGASDCQISGNNFSGEMRLELLVSSTVQGNTVHGTNSYGINLLGAIGNTFTSNVLKNYTDWGLLLNSTSKNSTVQSSNNVIGPNLYDVLSKTTHQNATGTGNQYCEVSSGTWTAAIVGASTAGTYELAGTSAARYTKVGNMVTLTATLTLASSITGGGSGNLRISGVPFPRVNTVTPIGSVMLRGVDFTGTAPVVRFVGDSELYIPVVNDNGAEVAVDVSGLAASDTINISITYEAQEQ